MYEIHIKECPVCKCTFEESSLAKHIICTHAELTTCPICSNQVKAVLGWSHICGVVSLIWAPFIYPHILKRLTILINEKPVVQLVTWHICSIILLFRSCFNCFYFPPSYLTIIVQAWWYAYSSCSDYTSITQYAEQHALMVHVKVQHDLPSYRLRTESTLSVKSETASP